MNEYVQVFMTIDDREAAEGIAKEILEKRLAACFQIAGPITSLYWWEGEIKEGEEWLCIMKTTGGLYRELEEALKKMHPYEVAEILAVPVAAGNQDYLDWVHRAVAG